MCNTTLQAYNTVYNISERNVMFMLYKASCFEREPVYLEKTLKNKHIRIVQNTSENLKQK